ncbi:MAG: DnaA N-terminal domain-containing protein [Vicinamibacterales bacterium]
MPPDAWTLILDRLRARIDSAEFRRWFASTAYASDSGDQITVWVPTETDRRYLQSHFLDAIDQACAALDRPGTSIRFVVAGFGDDDEEE